jgi:hypothetical protein
MVKQVPKPTEHPWSRTLELINGTSQNKFGYQNNTPIYMILQH